MKRIHLKNLISISNEYNETKEMLIEAIKLGERMYNRAKTESKQLVIQQKSTNLIIFY